MNTAFLLMAQYNGAAIIPLADVCRDYFQHLSPEQFWRKFNEGHIDLPVTVMDPTSNKSAKGVALCHLADFLDAQIDKAKAELKVIRS